MTTFVVMEPVGWPKGEHARYVPDRFVLIAFLFPVIWFVFHRLWIEALVALAATLALMALGTIAGLQNSTPFLSFLVSIYVALEGASLRVAALERRGYRLADVIEAGSRAEAELRYLRSGRAPAAPAVSAGTAKPLPGAASAADAPMLGLLDYPGAR